MVQRFFTKFYFMQKQSKHWFYFLIKRLYYACSNWISFIFLLLVRSAGILLTIFITRTTVCRTIRIFEIWILFWTKMSNHKNLNVKTSVIRELRGESRRSFSIDNWIYCQFVKEKNVSKALFFFRKRNNESLWPRSSRFEPSCPRGVTLRLFTKKGLSRFRNRFSIVSSFLSILVTWARIQWAEKGSMSRDSGSAVQK